MVVGAAPERLRQFRVGTIDLRSLIVDGNDDNEWYLGQFESDRWLSLTRQESDLKGSQLLPDEGLVLRHRQVETDILDEAFSRKNLVFEVAVEPPETARDHRIRGEMLAKLLVHVQSLIKYGYRAALRDLIPAMRRTIESTSSATLDVVIPAAAGSFKIVFESENYSDLVGHNELSRGLERLDRLVQHASSAEETLSLIKADRGHIASAYLRLLRFLVASQTGIRYAWALPSAPKTYSGSVSISEAESLIEALSGVSDLGEESVELVGVLDEAYGSAGEWILVTEDGIERGKRAENGPSLAGLQIGARYRFSCLEKIEESEVSAKEKRTLFLVKYSPLK